jgi:hypothetical protein
MSRFPLNAFHRFGGALGMINGESGAIVVSKSNSLRYGCKVLSVGVAVVSRVRHKLPERLFERCRGLVDEQPKPEG